MPISWNVKNQHFACRLCHRKVFLSPLRKNYRILQPYCLSCNMKSKQIEDCKQNLPRWLPAAPRRTKPSAVHPICWCSGGWTPLTSFALLGIDSGSGKWIVMHQRWQILILQKPVSSSLPLSPKSIYFTFSLLELRFPCQRKVKKRQTACKSFLYLIQQYNPSFFHSANNAAKLSHVLQDSKWVS